MDKFIEVLQNLIDENDLTLRSLSKKINVAHQILYVYKSENQYPNIYTAAKIADYFSCSLNYLFGVERYFYEEKFNAINIKLFYPRYKELLEKKNISHYYLFKTIGLNKSGMTNWKAGTIPKPESLIKIAKYFNVSIDYLVGRSNEK